MKLYKIAQNIPDVWLGHADPFESKGVKWHLEVLSVDKIDVGWATNFKRKEIENAFRNGRKVPLILVEKKKNGEYELNDGNHRFFAYRNVFPKEKYIKAAVFFCCSRRFVSLTKT